MGLLRNRRSQSKKDSAQLTPAGTGDNSDMVGYNPHRDEYLYWFTEEGYIVAQDVICQHEYIQSSVCTHCEHSLVIAAHLNRSGQGLSEIVTICPKCRTRYTFIFDISNEVYQAWWAEQLGPLYVQQYEGPPREPYAPGS